MSDLPTHVVPRTPTQEEIESMIFRHERTPWTEHDRRTTEHYDPEFEDGGKCEYDGQAWPCDVMILLGWNESWEVAEVDA